MGDAKKAFVVVYRDAVICDLPVSDWYTWLASCKISTSPHFRSAVAYAPRLTQCRFIACTIFSTAQSHSPSMNTPQTQPKSCAEIMCWCKAGLYGDLRPQSHTARLLEGFIDCQAGGDCKSTDGQAAEENASSKS